LHQAGAGLVETMVGILIGLIVVLVIYNMLAAAEGYKRTAVGASDAQVTGLLSQFIVGREVQNGGNGITLAGTDLINCDPAKAQPAWPYMGLWRPIPLLIHASGSDDVSDSIVTLYSASPHVVWSVALTSDVTAAAADMTVQSPNGFTSPAPAASNYRVVAINAASGDCEDARVTSATLADAFGRVTLKQGVPATAQNYSTINGRLLNLGPVNLAARTQYEVRDPVANAPCDANVSPAPAAPRLCQLYSRNLLTADRVTPDAWTPLAQNVVLLKVQYGVDQSVPINGTVECWTPAIAGSPCGGGAVPADFSDTSVRGLPLVALQRIVAVRVGIVVRDDEPDLKEVNNQLKYANRLPMYLFNCAADTDAGCPGRILLSNKVIRDGWRYRAYEAVVPLRNAIFQALP
jgi:type IV pilus assembly protein PilW